MIQYLLYESKFMPSGGCYDNLNDTGGGVCCWQQGVRGEGRVAVHEEGRGGGGGVTAPSQTLGTQDKRSQSKGDVEVMKTKALRGRELLEAAVTLSTSDLLSPSSAARRISRPSLYGNLAPHENTARARAHTHTAMISFTSLGSKMKQDNLSATCDFLVF